MKNKKGFFSTIRSRFERNRLGELLVMRGAISTDDLHNALKEQKNSGKTLGHVLRDHGLVTTTQIRTSLMEQAAYRAMAACLTVFIGISAFHISPAKASNTGARSNTQQSQLLQNIAYTPQGQGYQNRLTAYPKLFGAREVASRDISAFKKWTGILNKLDRVTFNDSQIHQFRNLSLSAKVSAVNSYVNKVRYIEDKNNFGKSDYWATPTEFFARGGDCEDFAIAKYAILKQLGVPENRMRLAIVQDKIKNIPHAVLIVYTDNGSILMDNQIKQATQTASVDRYKPIYSINADGWWRHIS